MQKIKTHVCDQHCIYKAKASQARAMHSTPITTYYHDPSYHNLQSTACHMRQQLASATPIISHANECKVRKASAATIVAHSSLSTLARFTVPCHCQVFECLAFGASRSQMTTK